MTNEGYQKENNALIWNFLSRTFFEGYKHPGDEKWANFHGLELIPNYECNLGCQYCYVNRYGEALYPSKDWHNDELLMKNLNITINWLLENNYDPKLELFSGEAMVQNIGYQILETLLDRLKGKNGPIVVPTNYTWILSKERTIKMQELIDRSRKDGPPISLSASFDGKYCEANRPFRGSITRGCEPSNRIWEIETNPKFIDPRDDAYYDKCFDFAAKNRFGFHPMIYNLTIDKWIQNFEWFQENMKKRDIPWHNIYLLEVRNVEWSKKETVQFGEFVEYLMNFAWKMSGNKYEIFRNFLFRDKGFNILSSCLTQCGRGLGCSLQSGLYLRLADFSLGPCHRQSYEHMNMGNFTTDGHTITGVDVKNPELYIAEVTCNYRSFPYCEQCGIKHICSGGCLGAQYEVSGDSFTPFPTMCRMEMMKVRSIGESLKSLGVLDYILDSVRKEKADQIRNVLRK